MPFFLLIFLRGYIFSIAHFESESKSHEKCIRELNASPVFL